MNKIYKVKKNAAGNLVACSEFAKGHTKKAVLGSLLIIGALGMASTANAAIESLDDVEKEMGKVYQALQAENWDPSKSSNVEKLLFLLSQGNALATNELNENVKLNTQRLDSAATIYGDLAKVVPNNIKENKESITTLTRKAFQNQVDIVRNNASIEELYEYGHEVAERIGEIHDYNQKQTEAIDALNKASSANTDNIEKNKNYIQGLAEVQRAGVEVMTELNKNVEENKRDLSAVTGKAFKNQIDIQKNNESIEDLYEYGQQVADSIKDIHDHNKAQNDTIQDLITNSTNNTDNIAKNKADADAKFRGVQTDIANNKITLAQHTKKIDDNQRAIEAKLGGKVDLQKLAELKTSVDKNQTDIVKNKADIQDLAKVQQTGVKAIEELNKNVQTNKAAADTKFAATEDAITKNAKDITKNTTSISALDTKVSGFDGRINTLDSKVDTFDGRISALDSKVNTFDGRINALDDKFKNGMAAQAALNGLFQPYSVGKVSVSAAIGGYGSKSAIAIGAGYRVNPQLAFKGGTAINMGGSRKGSYNVGVNYEF